MDIGLVKDVLTELSSMIKKINEVNSVCYEMGCVDGTIIGTGCSDYTTESTTYNLTINGKKFELIDIPGIEGDESKFKEIIEQSLERSHLVFYVNGSGKKIENESLKKIKEYMRDGTSIYSVFNIHCKAKKERFPGIDKEYTEELEDAYEQEKEIVNQTKEELKSFLGENYKESIILNGLLAFCALAFREDNRTSIKNENDKGLRKDQEKYLKEYHNDKENMLEDSHINLLKEIIEGKISSFESDIEKENLKKLKTRIDNMLSKITKFKEEEEKKINGFIKACNEFESSCNTAKEDFLRTMRHVGRSAAEDAYYDLVNKLFDRIEQDGGKTKKEEIQRIFEMEKDGVIEKIQKGVNSKIEMAEKTFVESIEEARKEMIKDFEREQLQFEISLSSDGGELSSAFAEDLKYNFKDFEKHAFNAVSLAISGAGIGSVIPALGTVIGAAVGAVLGIFNGIWNFFANKKNRINAVKSKIRDDIDDCIYEVSQQINNELKKLSYEEKIKGVYNSIRERAEMQRKNLSDIKSLLSNLENEISKI